MSAETQALPDRPVADGDDSLDGALKGSKLLVMKLEESGEVMSVTIEAWFPAAQLRPR